MKLFILLMVQSGVPGAFAAPIVYNCEMYRGNETYRFSVDPQRRTLRFRKGTAASVSMSMSGGNADFLYFSGDGGASGGFLRVPAQLAFTDIKAPEYLEARYEEHAQAALLRCRRPSPESGPAMSTYVGGLDCQGKSSFRRVTLELHPAPVGPRLTFVERHAILDPNPLVDSPSTRVMGCTFVDSSKHFCEVNQHNWIQRSYSVGRWSTVLVNWNGEQEDFLCREL